MTEAVFFPCEIDDFDIAELLEPPLFQLCQNLPDEKVDGALHL